MEHVNGTVTDTTGSLPCCSGRCYAKNRYRAATSVVYAGQKYAHIFEEVNVAARVFLHPTSLNFDIGKFDSPWLVYFDKVQTSKIFVRDAYARHP